MSIKDADIAVVGGGIVGCATAYCLQQVGARVVLIDGAHIGRASDAGAGILSAHTTWRTDDLWFSFAHAAGNFYPTLCNQLVEDGADNPGYEVCGLLTVSLEDGDTPWFDDLAKYALGRLTSAVHEIDPSDARQMFPPLGRVKRALFNPKAARIDGKEMTKAFRSALSNLDVPIVHDAVKAIMVGKTKVQSVVLEHEDIPVGAVVVCAGAWTPVLCEPLGMALPIAPVKGQIIHLDLPEGSAPASTWPIVQPIFGHYLVPWPDQRVACGGTFEDKAGFDARVTAHGIHELLRECLKLAPGLADASVRDVRVGFRPFCSDDKPVVGPSQHVEGLFVNAGHGADGLLVGPYSAAILARCIMGDDHVVEAEEGYLREFTPDRFARNSAS